MAGKGIASRNGYVITNHSYTHWRLLIILLMQSIHARVLHTRCRFCKSGPCLRPDGYKVKKYAVAVRYMLTVLALSHIIECH